MVLKKFILLILTLGFDVLFLYPQNPRDLSIAFTSEAVAFPFSSYMPVHPGIECGFSLKKVEKRVLTRSYLVYLGGYHHSKIENGFYLKLDYQNSIRVKNAIRVDFPLGIGYLHSYYPGEVYNQDTSTGEFEKTRQWGKPHAQINAGIGISFIKNPSFQPFIKQELMVEAPFIYGFPAIPHSFLKIGITLKIQSNDK